MGAQLAEEEKAIAPEELEEEESPYLRRQKAMTVRRQRHWQGWRWILVFFPMLALLGVAGYFVTIFALSSPWFELHSADDIQVTGNQFVSLEEVANALGVPLRAGGGAGVKVFRVSLDTQRKQVESIAWVRSASLTRVLPNRLVIHVVERTPVAFANVGGRVGLVDGDGMILDKPESASFDFPVITGLDPHANSDECRARMALYLDFTRQLGEVLSRSGWAVSEADLADPDDLKALLVQGRENLQVHFGHESFLARFHTFQALLPELRKSDEPIDSVDLRYRNQVVVNPQGRTPVPAPGDAGTSQTLKE